LREIALHLLDIVENSVAAGAKAVEISVEEALQDDRLKLVVEDDGKGMDQELLARVTDPFVTSRTTRKVGLGIPLLKAAAEACQGQMHLTSTPGKGTHLEVEFQRSHIDRMPLGDLAGTWLTLTVAFPKIKWLFRYRAAGTEFRFDSEPITRELGEISLTEPSILAFIRELLQEGVDNVKGAITKEELSRKL
jgi:anti-sigma regulatory factor (Ser/Thr protein kinase)